MSTDNLSILLTGSRGYIGSVMAAELVAAGHRVVGLDTGYFSECTLVPDRVEIPEVTKDLRDVELEDVRGFDAIVHLGALSNDPIGNLDSGWTEEINHRASVRLAELAREAGVRRFLFSSSCIMYGMSSADVVDEDSPLDPQTEYARSKVMTEEAISGARDRRLLADVPPERNRVRHLAQDALRHGAERSRRPRLHDRPDHGLQRREAVAAGDPRRRTWRAASRTCFGRPSRSCTTRRSTTAPTG